MQYGVNVGISADTYPTLLFAEALGIVDTKQRFCYIILLFARTLTLMPMAL